MVSCFVTGVQTKRAALCRQVSQHRDLHKDKSMVFSTTYRDTYKDNRPKSCPASVSKHPVTPDKASSLKKDDTLNSSKDSGIEVIDLEDGDSKSEN